MSAAGPLPRRSASLVDPGQRSAAAAACPPPDTLTPADRYEELFVAVQSQRLFADSKDFVDCVPRGDPQAILAAYRREHRAAGFDLGAFVRTHFAAPTAKPSEYVAQPGLTLTEHIDALWPVLTRQPLQHPVRSSLLPLPHAYVVPGGRFAELYYWDSYFVMLGLAESGCTDVLHAMTDNFAYLIDTYGHVPNGTRTYYLSRSQPPVFALMAELCEDCDGPPAASYLPQLRKEHAWWMDGADGLRPGEARRRVVRLADGALLNRYWDDRDSPREESWREDVATAAESERPCADVYRDLRAAAESGWDFSTRWLHEPSARPPEPTRGPVPGPGGLASARRDGAQPPGCPLEPDDPANIATPRLADICTTAILPVDLNAFLYKLEATIARLGAADGDVDCAEGFGARAQERQSAVKLHLWNAEQGGFFDFDWQRSRPRRCLTAATVVPLFTGLADPAQAAALADTLERRLLAPGGLATTEVFSDEQWDRPNGWAPLQWMAIRGLADYGHTALAQEIARRWLATVDEVFRRESKLVEKYALRQVSADRSAGGGGGEYPLQDGFGWTNGVTRRLLAQGFERGTKR
ncbi:MAG: alpha,alpha-trehalase TreF [Methylibium sp.]|uniref:trehalase family glycosidase n=1 Tax=Methylibium sp. TaxID=2067992 RepID=UPI0017A7489B|nr:trehalase family glycosidase [Methylibium sp.]MBA3597995.1 alpha,alpha-trehalase TreF [Methylibium sp.]